MQETRIASRYAKAIIEQAIEKKELDAIFSDATGILELLDKSRELNKLFTSPVIAIDKKVVISGRVFKDSSIITQQFIKLLIKKNRSLFIKSIYKEVVRQYRELKGISEATVYSVIPLTDELSKDIKSRLKAQYQKTFELTNIIDKSLIGGFVLRYEDRLLDASIASKLKALRKEIITN